MTYGCLRECIDQTGSCGERADRHDDDERQDDCGEGDSRVRVHESVFED